MGMSEYEAFHLKSEDLGLWYDDSSFLLAVCGS